MNLCEVFVGTRGGQAPADLLYEFNVLANLFLAKAPKMILQWRMSSTTNQQSKAGFIELLLY